jgi:hypothetical protein
MLGTRSAGVRVAGTATVRAVPDESSSTIASEPEDAHVTGDPSPHRPLRPSAPGWRRWLTGHRIAIGVVLALSLAFYMWTAATTTPFTFGKQNTDVYNELTTGFLHGHTYVAMTPPAGLLRLKNPFDPVQNAPYQSKVHFLALHNGHLYSAWGPTPVVTLFLPFRITSLRMSQSFAVALYGFLGLLCAVALLHLLGRRFVPKTPDWLFVVASAGLALTSVVPFILRRPDVYETAVSAGYCFGMAGLLLIARGLTAARRRRLELALGSLCLGLAAGARISLAPLAVVAVAAAVYLIRRRNEPYRILIPLLAPLLACAVFLAAYNAVRFGSISEFGSSYQVATLNTSTRAANQLSYIPPGLFSYLLIPPRLALTFPHVFLTSAAEYPFSLPRGYQGSPSDPYVEPAGGLLPTAPITLLLLLLPILWRRWPPDDRRVLLVASGLAGLGLVIVGGLSWVLWGTTERYEVDYTTLFLLPAFLVWAALMSSFSDRRRIRRATAVAGVGLTGFGAVVGTAISFTGYYDGLRIAHPRIFRTLEDTTSPFATLATMTAGKPVIVRVDHGALPVDLPAQGYGNFGQSDASTSLGNGGPVTVTVIAPGAETTALRLTAAAGPGAPRRSPLKIRVQSPDRAAVTVPVTPGYMHVPVSLHWGLNRITLSVAGATPTSAEVVQLGDIVLSP